ncbi:hypothetical protein SK128_013405 [Halocaridina rubra]|uniref:Secreted protein n=1 Tax=Halocaridina rubra TaxID=373956 RepID=A0AAN8X564_HALRR
MVAALAALVLVSSGATVDEDTPVRPAKYLSVTLSAAMEALALVQACARAQMVSRVSGALSRNANMYQNKLHTQEATRKLYPNASKPTAVPGVGKVVPLSDRCTRRSHKSSIALCTHAVTHLEAADCNVFVIALLYFLF